MLQYIKTSQHLCPQTRCTDNIIRNGLFQYKDHLLKHRDSHHTDKAVEHLDSLMQDCSNSSALAMELLQSCIKPSMLSLYNVIRIQMLLRGYIYTELAHAGAAYINGLVQDCSNSSTSAMVSLQSCIKPTIQSISTIKCKCFSLMNEHPTGFFHPC